MSEPPSRPSWLKETIASDPSTWTHPKPTSSAKSSHSSIKSTKDTAIREKNKRLRCIYEDEGLTYGEDVGEKELVDRFKVAVGLRGKRIEQVFCDIRASRVVDLCFLVDSTGSMQPHINGVRNSILNIVESLTNKSKHVGFVDSNQIAESIRLAFVAYRDFGDSKQFEVLPFTKSVEEFRLFCNRLNANGGGDGPEDVFGGLTEMLKLNWASQSGTKVTFHIADYPCHGREFHDLDDSYPSGDPNGRTHTELFNQIRQQGIQYHFGKITNHTDKMITKFSQAYGEPIVDFDIKNVEKIRESVVSAVTISVSTSITKSTAAGGRSKETRYFTIDPKEPNWNKLPKLKGVFITYEFPHSIEDIITDVPLTRKKPKNAEVQISEAPFDQGAERIAFYGRDVSSYVEERVDESGSKSKSVSKHVDSSEIKIKYKCEDIVLKEYKHVGKGMNSARRYETTNQLQTIASYLAQLFVKELKMKAKKEVVIKFLKIKTLSVSSAKNLRMMSCERRYSKDDKFLRFTNNTDYGMLESTAKKYGVDLEFVDLLMSFSHWTYQASDKKLMVVDLQGIISTTKTGEKAVFLTDPAIHCDDNTRFGPMNLGKKGMENFFSRHKCNKFCDVLGLKLYG
uniref:Alpha-type protein kinase domain-containing protein n=1 Tax=Acrobeloides nanus TaxID=290746 RepID=A0A914CDW0_9BILA